MALNSEKVIIMIFDKRTAKSLEWDMLVEEWRKRCHTSGGAVAVTNLALYQEWSEADERLQMIEELRKLKREGRGIYISDIPEMEDILSVIEKGGYLKAKDLSKIILHLRNVKDVQKQVDEKETPVLSRRFGGLESMGYLLSMLDASVDEEGNVRSDASPSLYGLRKRLQELRNETVKKLENMMQSSSVAPYLQDDFYTVREERYVIPVKSEFRSQVPGMIHGISSSGQTVYIEPFALVDLNSRIREIRLDIELEELRILSDLGDAVSDELSKLKRNMSLMSELDAWLAAAQLADDLSLEPWIFGNKLALRRVRHPVLLAMGRNVVPNDVILEPKKILLVTGPNAGGKTILLKTIGLSIAMASVGLPVLAKDSEIPRYERLHAMIGDAQDITDHKSTFSGHIEWLKHIIEGVKSRDLVLIDELASGTDPAQGAALAQAILEFLGDRHAQVVATTHYSVLKALALTDSRFANASIGGTGIQPDYKLVFGVPGVSSGINLARRLGLPEKIIKRAESIFREGDRGLDELFRQLREREAFLKEQEEQLAASLSEVEELKSILQREKKVIERQRIEIIEEKRDETMKELDRLKEMIAVLQTRAKRSKKSGRETRSSDLKQSVERITGRIRDLERSITKEPELKVGAKVRSLSLGREVEVLEIRGNRVKVRSGALFVELGKDDLRSMVIPEEDKREHTERTSRRPSGKVKPGISTDATDGPTDVHIMKPSTTLDLRGRRVDDGLEVLEKFIDQMMMKGESSFTVIHGYGSGAMMKAVRDYLKKSPYIASFRPGQKGEGGDGVTVAFCV